MTIPERYILVNALTGQAHKPKVHETIEDAEREAERLARLSPGAKIYIFKSVACCVEKSVKWNREYLPGFRRGEDSVEFPEAHPTRSITNYRGGYDDDQIPF